MTRFQTIAIVGCGLIGQGWAVRFALTGRQVRLFDAAPNKAADAHARIAKSLEALQSAGMCDDVTAALECISCSDALEDALTGADYVQESVLERTDIKQAVSAQIEACLAPNALVGSSSSGIPASAFTETLRERDRFFIVHPVNPPHLVPVVEIVPAPWSDKDHIPEMKALMADIGMSPIVVEREIEGFILNRLQGALLNEAWALYEEGYASADDIDKTVRDGLGRRWAFMGPFETIALNAPDGIADYAGRLGPLYHAIAQSRTKPRAWSQDTARKLDEELRTSSSGQERDAVIARRDDMLLKIMHLLRR